jgi:uncharacterized RDD family membrane protein YckC
VVRRAEVIEAKPWAAKEVDRPHRALKDPALELPLSGWGRRFASGLIDTVIGWALTLGLLFIFAPSFLTHLGDSYMEYVRQLQGVILTGGNAFSIQPTALQYAVSTLLLAAGGVVAVYSIVFMGTWGATIGQRLCGITVVKAPLPVAILEQNPQITFKVEKPGWVRSFFKGLAWAFFSTGGSIFILVQLVNALLPLWHKRKQSLTDLFANTLVIRANHDQTSPST